MRHEKISGKISEVDVIRGKVIEDDEINCIVEDSNQIDSDIQVQRVFKTGYVFNTPYDSETNKAASMADVEQIHGNPIPDSEIWEL